MARLLTTVDGNLESFGLPFLQPVVLWVADGKAVVEGFAGSRPRPGPIVAPVGPDGHMLLAGGEPVVLTGCAFIAGACHLANGDTIAVGELTFTYSTADWVDLARVERYEGAGKCLINRDPLIPGEEVVFCPGCGIAMHGSCVDASVKSCPVCGTPVAHTYEEAVAITRQAQRAW